LSGGFDVSVEECGENEKQREKQVLDDRLSAP
jgi:hypothetical protein